MKSVLNPIRFLLFLNFLCFSGVSFEKTMIFAQDKTPSPAVFRLGIIGTDTSHVPAFVNLFNDPNAEGDYQKFQITGAVKGGMPDNESSWGRKDGYAEEISKKGVTIYDSIEEMLPNVDGVLIESVDGRPHLEFARPVIAAGKPLFIDKPMAGNLWEVLEIFRLAHERNVPVFSASSLRYSAGIQQIRVESPYGKTHGVDAWSPCHLNEKHPDFYWYGIHGVETLFTMMGPGCVSVSRTSTPDYDLAAGVWNDGRIGTFRGIRAGSAPYGGAVFGNNGVALAGKYDGYKPLCDEICKFFLTGKSPVEDRETLEIMAFMTAADVSKARDGAHVTLEEVLGQAENFEVKTFQVVLNSDGKFTLDGTPVTLEELTQKLTFPAQESTQESSQDASQNSSQTMHRPYFRVILENKSGISGDSLTQVLQGLGDAVLVRYLY